MKHVSTEVLIQRLRSEDIMERGLAAEELGARGAREAVAPLLAAVSDIDDIFSPYLFSSSFLFEALAALGDPAAVGPLVRMVEVTAGYLIVTPFMERPCEVACKSLVRLDASSALADLEGLQARWQGTACGRPLARALIALGGQREAELFTRLLDGGSRAARATAAEALGRLQHHSSIPALQRLCDDRDNELRWSAHCALVALGAPGALAALEAEMLRTTGDHPRGNLLCMIDWQGLTSHAEWVCERVDDPRWASSPQVTFETFDVAMQLGSANARRRLRHLHEDASQSPCARARAAGILLDHGEDRYLPYCLEFLQRHGGYAEADPRDPRDWCNHTHRELLDVARRHGTVRRDRRLLVVDTLYSLLRATPDDWLNELQTEGFSPSLYAGQVMYVLTGTFESKRFHQWRAEYAAT